MVPSSHPGMCFRLVRTDILVEERRGVQAPLDQDIPRHRSCIDHPGYLRDTDPHRPQDRDIPAALPDRRGHRVDKDPSDGAEMQKMQLEGELDALSGVRGDELEA